MSIEAVLFDMDGTLVDVSTGEDAYAEPPAGLTE